MGPGLRRDDIVNVAVAVQSVESPANAHRNRQLRRTLQELPLGHSGAIQHGDRLLRPPCRRLRQARADLCRRGRRHAAAVVRRDQRAVEALRQRAEGRRPRARRSRRGVPVAVGRTADRASGRVPLRSRLGAAVHAVRRGRAGIPPLQFRREGGHHRRRRLGEAVENSRPSAASFRTSTSPAARFMRAPNRSGRRSRMPRRISRPSTPQPTIPPSSSTPQVRPEIPKARCTPIACCSATCRMSRWRTTSFPSPAT